MLMLIGLQVFLFIHRTRACCRFTPPPRRWPTRCPRALYMAVLEVTKSSVGSAAVRLGVSEPAASVAASAAAGVSVAVAAQVVWTPVDVISQRLMV
jgi:hypothetical protein